MEESLNRKIKNRFELNDVDIRTYSPLTLAFIGDDVFDIVIRSLVVNKGNTSPGNLQKYCSSIVKASTQSEMAEILQDVFTEEEQDIYRRGRNAKSKTTAKNATVSDYRSATGFEAVMGYLYLTEQSDRILELIQSGLERLNISI